MDGAGTAVGKQHNSKPRTAVVAGATGLIGSELVSRLLAATIYSRVIALARRPPGTRDARLQVVAVDFDQLDRVLAPHLGHRDLIDAYCCLGTTFKTAGSKQQFRRVDHDYVLAFGRWAHRVGVRRMIVVSALGADSASRVFYNRVKGETERDLAALGLASLVIVRPSLLAGERSEFRLGERLALAVARPLAALLPAGLRPVAAADVAQAMVDAALAEQPPSIIESAALHRARV
jgi:uncharacterized protein YbjT (DUF2867 family)